MAWSYKYTSLSELINDLETNPKGIWNTYGRVDALEVNRSNFTVAMYTLTYGSQIKNLARYVFSLDEFLTMPFSKELPGLNIYISEDKTRSLFMWDALSQESKDLYQKTALRLLSEERLKVYWPPESTISNLPALEVKIGSTPLSNNSVYDFTPGSPQLFGDVETRVLRITNRGEGTLRFLGNPKVLLQNSDQYNNFLYTGLISKDYLLKDESIELDIDFSALTAGTKSATITILTNDPSVATYILTLRGTADETSFDRGPNITWESDLIFEKGQELTTVELKVLTEKTYYPISGVNFYSGVNFIGEISNPNPDGGHEIFFYSPSQPISSDIIFDARVFDGTYGGNAVKELKFKNKVYWGYSLASGSYTSEDILLLGNSNLQDVASGTYDFGSNDVASGSDFGAYVLFSYPASMGNLMSVVDTKTGFVYYSQSFIVETINLENAMGYNSSYKVVRSVNRTFASDINWRINIE